MKTDNSLTPLQFVENDPVGTMAWRIPDIRDWKAEEKNEKNTSKDSQSWETKFWSHVPVNL